MARRSGTGTGGGEADPPRPTDSAARRRTDDEPAAAQARPPDRTPAPGRWPKLITTIETAVRLAAELDAAGARARLHEALRAARHDASRRTA